MRECIAVLPETAHWMSDDHVLLTPSVVTYMCNVWKRRRRSGTVLLEVLRKLTNEYTNLERTNSIGVGSRLLRGVCTKRGECRAN